MRIGSLLLGFVVCSGFVTAAEMDFAAVEKRIQELQPRPEEKRFDEIGWAKDIREARRLSAERNRPVFLFTHDGRMNIGRC
ncbi:MAG TPA: hypothetical protein VK615_15635 [Candidatus Binatia bacterium]|nr:hypothetical protein [Candidatus Binatia bacterium]